MVTPYPQNLKISWLILSNRPSLPPSRWRPLAWEHLGNGCRFQRSWNLWPVIEKSGMTFSDCCYSDSHLDKPKDNEWMNHWESNQRSGHSLEQSVMPPMTRTIMCYVLVNNLGHKKWHRLLWVDFLMGPFRSTNLILHRSWCNAVSWMIFWNVQFCFVLFSLDCAALVVPYF